MAPPIKQSETKQTANILVIKYEKVDLSKVVKENCDHLTSAEC